MERSTHFDLHVWRQAKLEQVRDQGVPASNKPNSKANGGENSPPFTNWCSLFADIK
jgi:hypothetical protein